MTPGDDDPLTPDEGTIDAGSQLTAEELAALAESLQGSAPRPARPTQDVRQEAEQKAVVLRYDLVGSRTTHHYDMPALDLVQEQFALVLAGILSRTTRQEATFRAKDPVILNFSEVYASLRMPSGISVVEVQGVGGNGLVLFDAELLLHLVDLLMGGNGGPSDVMARVTERGFTATEKHLIRTMVEMVDKALCQAWADITPVGLRVTRIAADPRHAAIFLPGDRVASFEVETTWGAITGSIRFVLPVEALRPFEKRLAQTATTPSLTPDKDWHGAIARELNDVKVTLNAHLGRTRLSLGELLALQEGDILRLDRGPSDLVDVRVEGVVKYEAHPMGRGGNHAIEVVRKMAVPSVARNMAAPVQHTHLPEGEDTMTQSGEEAEGASDE